MGDGGEETVVEWVVLQACFCSMTRVESGDFGSMNKVACGVYMTVYASLSLLSKNIRSARYVDCMWYDTCFSLYLSAYWI